MSDTINSKYIVESQDERDGGRHLVVLSLIDDRTGVKTRTTFATFEPFAKAAAEAYAMWMNTDRTPVAASCR